jgi:hypothetical protein
MVSVKYADVTAVELGLLLIIDHSLKAPVASFIVQIIVMLGPSGARRSEERLFKVCSAIPLCMQVARN